MIKVFNKFYYVIDASYEKGTQYSISIHIEAKTKEELKELVKFAIKEIKNDK